MKKVFLTIIIFSVFVFLGSAAKAGRFNASMSGWGWGGTEQVSDGNPSNGLSGWETGVGWTSMNSSDCEDINTGRSIGGVNCPAAGSALSDYGVNMPHSGAGPVTGYAWNNNLGYIDFNPQAAGHCAAYAGGGVFCQDPDGGTGGVNRRADDYLEGWALIVDIAKENRAGNSAGWKGWIKMKGQDAMGNDYGVRISPIDGSITSGQSTSFAWSEELGYIDFRQAKNNCIPSTFTCELVSTGDSCDDPANCSQTITTGTAVCMGRGVDGCSSTISLTTTDCSDHGVACPAASTETCTNAACSVHSGTWREVTPN